MDKKSRWIFVDYNFIILYSVYRIALFVGVDIFSADSGSTRTDLVILILYPTIYCSEGRKHRGKKPSG